MSGDNGDNGDARGIEREYGRRRALSISWWQITVDLVVGGNIVLQVTTNPYASRLWYVIVLVALVLARVVQTVLYRQRGRTIVNAQGITAHEALRTNTRTWQDIYDIRAELNANGRFERAQWTTYVYADDGRRTRLPYFDDWQLPDFHAELADLRAVSALHRGMDWELRPDTEDRIRRRARDRKVWGAVFLAAFIAALAAFVFLA
ncbi:PH domain-containing protein [Streptomyces prunicolor]|uniref:PH domain-containing protein n=1 Tax=Streptomyces prunicolor TaxID=67348 RepID=A0ABU4F568_9ACTN|nr:PH domain-containing protein [Streptomyces prunicolor]MDV7215121.1 PH domain-containing protein [Streptomyces prunicolor]